MNSDLYDSYSLVQSIVDVLITLLVIVGVSYCALHLRISGIVDPSFGAASPVSTPAKYSLYPYDAVHISLFTTGRSFKDEPLTQEQFT
ncbi:MAG: hypothetical protein ACPGN3_04725 [Opitutales bacterium]